MDVDEAIKEMTGCADFEAAFMGEQFWWHKGTYLTDLMKLGFTLDEAEKGLVQFCQSVVNKVERGEEVTFPDYRDELVALIAKHGRAEVVEAA